MRQRHGVLGKTLGVLLTAFVLATGGLAMPAAWAGNCTYGFPPCGEIWNQSPLWIMISDHWCCTDNAPRYGWSVSGEPFKLQPGQESDNLLDPRYNDTDSFRVDAGCVTKFYNASPYGFSWPHPAALRVEDRRGMARHKWIKISNDDAIRVTAQSCSVPPAKYWVDTFGTANGYQDPWCYNSTSGGARCNSDGKLYAGTNYVFCKMRGRQVGGGSSYNLWWLLTDLDWVDRNAGRDGRAFVSAYYLSRWGNDEAKDNNGTVIPNC
jgi:hypothetical protein